MKNVYFIERLSLVSFCFYTLPFIVSHRVKGKIKLYFIDATRPGIAVARLSARFLNADLQKFAFRLMDFRGPENLSLDLKVCYFDLAKAQEEILRNISFGPKDERFKVYVMKQLAREGLLPDVNLLRALHFIRIVRLQLEKEGDCAAHAFFMRRRAWSSDIIDYARILSVNVVPVADFQFNLKAFLKNCAAEKIHLWKSKYFYWFQDGWKKKEFSSASSGSPKLAVEYYGHLNLDDPRLYSDLFFLQPSQMPAEDILLLFHLSQDPLDENKTKILSRYGIKALGLKPGATTVSDVPIFYHKSSLQDIHAQNKEAGGPLERQWRKQVLSGYCAEVNYWRDLFARTQSKIYLSWHMNSPQHCAIAEAMQKSGGVMAIYQRSYQEFPSVLTAIAADVAFSFSPNNFELEKKSGSAIDWHVAVGYSGDHRFQSLKPHACAIREQLEIKGARRVIAYFDENSHDDDRWYPGHAITRNNYAFLFEKVLSDPALGLVIKPKTPSTLARRLGPVAELLQKAKATGRCFVFEQGAMHGSYPPATAALAADFAIHGHLCAATAGLESALAGVPTILMDFEGWSVSNLYKQGFGKFVFTSWEELWSAALRYWQNPQEANGFGDWAAVLNDIDPFRDGRAAERIGTYLKWILEGFKAGGSRETVLSDAAERYAKIWGRDKIASLSVASKSIQPELVAP